MLAHSLWHCPPVNRESRECKGTKRKLHEMGGTPSGSDVHWEAMQEPSQPIDIKYERAEIEDFPPTSNVRWEAMNSQT